MFTFRTRRTRWWLGTITTAKLRSVDAIGEEEYRRALGEPIVVAGGRPPG